MKLAEITTYGQFREALGTELKNQAEGFVRTGYLLKVARDTDILKESGYGTVAEFAQAEYGLSKDIVSRYIAINDRYAKDGYSEYLREEFEGYGIAKLQEMLTLPDEVINLMTPELTKREIQDIKREIKEEEKISDIEVMLEARTAEPAGTNLLQQTLHGYFYEQRKEFAALASVMAGESEGEDAIEQVMDTLAPSGVAVKSVRLPGIGRIMFSLQGKEREIELLNVRTNERENASWQQFIGAMQSICKGRTGADGWEEIYGEPFRRAEVAPVQPDSKPLSAPQEESKPQENVKQRGNTGENAAGQQAPEKAAGQQAPEKATVQQAQKITEEAAPVASAEPEPEEIQTAGQKTIEEYREYIPKESEGHREKNRLLADARTLAADYLLPRLVRAKNKEITAETIEVLEGYLNKLGAIVKELRKLIGVEGGADEKED